MKNILLYSIIIFSTLASSFSYAAEIPSGIDQATTVAAAGAAALGAEAAGVALKESCSAVVGIGACITVATDLYYVGKDTKAYLYPSAKQKVHALEVQEEYEKVQARREYKRCLLNNTSSQRSPFGYPTTCEEAALMFEALAEHDEFHQLTTTFNRLYQE